MKAAKERYGRRLAPRPGSIRIIYPLDEFYAERGEAVPAIERVEPDEMPEPYRSLLDHKTDMTSTLERFYQETLHIEVLARHLRESEYFREVVLVLDRQAQSASNSAPSRSFSTCSPMKRARRFCASGSRWAGFCNRFNIPFASRPGAFLRLASDKFIDAALAIAGGRTFSMAAAIRWSMRGSGPWPRSWRFCRRNHP